MAVSVVFGGVVVLFVGRTVLVSGSRECDVPALCISCRDTLSGHSSAWRRVECRSCCWLLAGRPPRLNLVEETRWFQLMQ